jgi:signal transduction histidine kinase
VTDLETDPRWADYRELARPHGFRACWSTPVLTTDGRVLGTFALYYTEPRAPSDADMELLARAGHVTGIAIERRQLEDQLRALSQHAESVREDERTGIARAIHDELGQALTALKMDIAWIGRRLASTAIDREAISEKLDGMSQMTDEVIHQVRRISAELRPGVLDDLGLIAALEWQGQEFEKRTGTHCLVHSELGEEVQIDRNLSTAVFRIFQEALTNITRHAHARHVDVVLKQEGECLRLDVRDDGDGIPPEALHNPTSLGLLGMRERARQLGGTATVNGAPRRGTLVSLSVPLHRGMAP